MKKLLFALIPIFILQSCSSFEDVTITRIKDGSFNACSEATIGDLANNFLSNPKWEAIIATDGMSYVNLTGGMTLDGKPVDALVQFTAPMRDYDDFGINAFELDEIPQNALMISELVNVMCVDGQ
tara:strand:- start:266 stop:640 length:375 start_codon:yes stop_codon:yes gene_type:complete